MCLLNMTRRGRTDTMRTDLEQHIKANIKEAINRGYIQPYYQPVIRTISRKLCSFEALARWIDPDYGMIL